MNMPGLTLGKTAEKSLDIEKIVAFAPSIVAIVASVAIGFFIVWPKFSETLRLQQSNKALEATTIKLEEKASALAGIDRAKLKKQLGAAEQLLPSEKNIFTFIRQIENVRNDSGVVISSLSVGSVGQFDSGSANSKAKDAPAAPPPPTETDATSGAGASAVDMKLTVSSDFKSVTKFLNDVYALPRVTLVKDLTFGAGKDGQITSNLTVSSLWQAMPTDLPAVEAPLNLISKTDEDLLTKIDQTGEVANPVTVPDVPKGRPDIFTPF